MRPNQKRALFSAIAPATTFLILTTWYLAFEAVMRKLFTSPEGYSITPIVRTWLDGTNFAIAFFGAICIPLGLIVGIVLLFESKSKSS